MAIAMCGPTRASATASPRRRAPVRDLYAAGANPYVNATGRAARCLHGPRLPADSTLLRDPHRVGSAVGRLHGTHLQRAAAAAGPEPPGPGLEGLRAVAAGLLRAERPAALRDPAHAGDPPLQ